MDRKDQNQENRIPDAGTNQPMNNKKDVEKSNDSKIDQDFPGYPHYPAKEDIMDQRTDSKRVDLDVENIPANRNTTGMGQRFASGEERSRKDRSNADAPEEDLGIQMGTDADVTDDDLAILNATDAEIGNPQNVSNEELNSDLDIPGSELDDADEEIGEEDEENNYYSLGGDRQEANEEDPYSGPDRGQ